LIKTLLAPIQTPIYHGNGDMRKTTVILILISALLITATTGTLFTKSAKANPYSQAIYQGEIPSPFTKPTITITFPLNNTIINTSSISVILNASIARNVSNPFIEYLSKIYYTSDWQQNETCIYEYSAITNDWPHSKFNHQLNLTQIPEGNHNLTFYAIETGTYYPSLFDYYKLTANDSSTITFTVDTAPPNITILSLKNKTHYAYNSDIPLISTINEPTNKITYSLDAKNNSTVIGNTTLSGLTAGEHNITVYAWDAAGNTGTSETINFTIDDPFPLIPVATTAAVVTVAACAGLPSTTKNTNIKQTLRTLAF